MFIISLRWLQKQPQNSQKQPKIIARMSTIATLSKYKRRKNGISLIAQCPNANGPEA